MLLSVPDQHNFKIIFNQGGKHFVLFIFFLFTTTNFINGSMTSSGVK